MGSDIRISSCLRRTHGPTGFLPVCRLWHRCPRWLLRHSQSRTDYFDFKCVFLPYGRVECVSTPSPAYITLHTLLIFHNRGAAVSTIGLWHYPASITIASIAVEFARFAPTAGFATASTAGVINTYSGRQQVRHRTHTLISCLHASDGVLHRGGNSVGLDLKLSPTCLDSLGYQRFMYVSSGRQLIGFRTDVCGRYWISTSQFEHTRFLNTIYFGMRLVADVLVT